MERSQIWDSEGRGQVGRGFWDRGSGLVSHFPKRGKWDTNPDPLSQNPANPDPPSDAQMSDTQNSDTTGFAILDRVESPSSPAGSTAGA